MKTVLPVTFYCLIVILCSSAIREMYKEFALECREKCRAAKGRWVLHLEGSEGRGL